MRGRAGPGPCGLLGRRVIECGVNVGIGIWQRRSIECGGKQRGRLELSSQQLSGKCGI